MANARAFRSHEAIEDERALLDRLQAGDEAAFMVLVERHHASMIRLAMGYVPNRAAAEDAVQDTWMGVLRGIDRFEGRAALKTWLFRILVNRARTTGSRERRIVPLLEEEPSVDPDRFGPDGHWKAPPDQWSEDVADQLSSAEGVALIHAAIDRLPATQRDVVLLRDVEGLTSAEVREVLGLTEGNQRVLLHRGRSKVRNMLEREFGKS